MSDERYCSNCRAALPEDADSCPECGVYAGDLYDERMHRPKTRFAPFLFLLVLALAAAGAAVWWNTRGTVPWQKPAPAPAVPSTRVVRDRPGGNVNEAEAIRLVRRHLVATAGIKTDCVALLGHGFTGGGYVVTANNRCENTRLGKWRVNVKTGEVTRAR
jgi:predicted nucleic acid-binding Zn ribbon protein